MPNIKSNIGATQHNIPVNPIEAANPNTHFVIFGSSLSITVIRIIPFSYPILFNRPLGRSFIDGSNNYINRSQGAET